MLATQLQMRPNDVVFIAEQPITRWNRVVQQFIPSLINTASAAVNQKSMGKNAPIRRNS